MALRCILPFFFLLFGCSLETAAPYILKSSAHEWASQAADGHGFLILSLSERSNCKFEYLSIEAKDDLGTVLRNPDPSYFNTAAPRGQNPERFLCGYDYALPIRAGNWEQIRIFRRSIISDVTARNHLQVQPNTAYIFALSEDSAHPWSESELSVEEYRARITRFGLRVEGFK